MKRTILNPQDTNSPLSEVSCPLVSEMSLPLLKDTEEISPGAEVLEGNAPSLQDPPKPPATAPSDNEFTVMGNRDTTQCKIKQPVQQNSSN